MSGNKQAAPCRLSEMQGKCLLVLAERSEPHGEMCLCFEPIQRNTGMSRSEVRRSVRALKRKGLAEFHNALCNDDGEFAGAGYCITPAGQERANAL